MPEIDLGKVVGPQGPQGEKGPQGAQGVQGPTGPAATINGVNALTIEEGENISLEQNGSALKISAAARNPNLLDNWYFANPINQRGASEYSGAVYGIDRWRGVGTGAAVKTGDGYVRFSTSAETGNAGLQQAVKLPVSEWEGKTLTLSVLVKDVGKTRVRLVAWLGAGSVNQTATADEANQMYYISTPGLHSLTIQVKSGAGYGSFNFGFRFESASGSQSTDYIDLVAAKLEFGSAQTLAHQDGDGSWVLNDPPPDPALELIKCQRYQRVYYRSDNNITMGLAACTTSTTQIVMTFPFSMRAIPSALNVEDLIVRDAQTGAEVEITSAKFYGTGGETGIILTINGTFSRGVVYNVSARTGHYLVVDANL